MFLRVPFQSLGDLPTEFVERVELVFAERQPDAFDGFSTLLAQRTEDVATLRRDDVGALPCVDFTDVRGDEAFVRELPQNLAHRRCAARAFACEQAGHEVLRLHLLERLPLLVGQADALRELSTTLGEDGSKTSQDFDTSERTVVTQRDVTRHGGRSRWKTLGSVHGPKVNRS